MELTILGAMGATGVELTRQALERVTAVARNPDRITQPASDRLTRVAYSRRALVRRSTPNRTSSCGSPPSAPVTPGRMQAFSPERS